MGSKKYRAVGSEQSSVPPAKQSKPAPKKPAPKKPAPKKY